MFSVSNHDTGIWYFRQLAIHFAKQFPRIFIIDNANMIRNNRAIPSMIRSASDPHFSERGRNQAIANIKAAMRFALPALSAYSTAVNDHIVKRRRDPHRPAPHAQFQRQGAAHTGIPDPPPPQEETPPVRRSRAPEPAPSTSQDTSSVSVGSIVHQCGLDSTYTSFAAVAGQGARPSAEASTGRPSSPTGNDRAQGNPLPTQGDTPPEARSTALSATSRDHSGGSQGARPKEPTSVGLPQRPPSTSTHRRSPSESLTQITKRTLESEAANLPPQGGAKTPSPSTPAANASKVAVPSLPPPVSEGATGGSEPQIQPAGPSQQTPAHVTTSTVQPDSVPANTQVTITPEMFEHFLRAPDSFYRMVGAASKGKTAQDSPKTPQ